MGAGDVDVQMVKLGGGTAVNDALLSGNIAFAGGGTGPLLQLWSATREHADVRGIGALVSLPMLLNTNIPELKELDDFTKAHRIGLPAVKVSRSEDRRVGKECLDTFRCRWTMTT